MSAADEETSTVPNLSCPVVNLPVRDTSLNPDISFVSFTITTLPSDTVPAVIPSNLLISVAMALILTPAMSSVCALSSPVKVILRIAVISLFSSRTTALDWAAVPPATPWR